MNKSSAHSPKQCISHVQMYECSEIVEGYNFCCDKCLKQEIKYLNDIGIETTGCCCGRHIGSKTPAFISVMPESEQKMRELGYKEYKNEFGVSCFRPKQRLAGRG